MQVGAGGAATAPAAPHVVPQGSNEPASRNGEPPSVSSLERRLETLSSEMTAQVSWAMSLLHQKGEELQKLVQTQREEMDDLRKQQAAMQDSIRAVARAAERGSVDNSQTEPTSREAETDSHSGLSGELLMKELREERFAVHTMLDNVRREKCEVIAVMHSFAMEKAEAMRELESARRTASDEISIMAQQAHKALSMSTSNGAGVLAATPNAFGMRPEGTVPWQSWSQAEAMANCEQSPLHFNGSQVHFQGVENGKELSDQLAGEDLAMAAAEAQGQMQAWTSAIPGGRQTSRPSLCMPGSVKAHIASGAVNVMTVQQMQQPMLGASPRPTLTATAPVMGGQEVTVAVASMEPPMRTLSPSRQAMRQYSAGIATGVLPVSVACSPALISRSAAGEARNPVAQATMNPAVQRRTSTNDPRRSPVRRFVSASGNLGLSPRPCGSQAAQVATIAPGQLLRESSLVSSRGLDQHRSLVTSQVALKR